METLKNYRVTKTSPQRLPQTKEDSIALQSVCAHNFRLGGGGGDQAQRTETSEGIQTYVFTKVYVQIFQTAEFMVWVGWGGRSHERATRKIIRVPKFS